MNPDTTYYSGKSPMTLTLDDGTTWTVNNAGDGEGGTMNVRQATIDSVNVIFAQLDLDVGSENVKTDGREARDHLAARRHPRRGNRRPADRGHTARAGRRLRVVRRRRRPPSARPRSGGSCSRTARPTIPDAGRATRAISDGIAYEVTDILKGVITEGTGAGYTDFGCPAAGKTGTTEGESDAWFVGYTPRLSTAVWVGHPLSRDLTASAARPLDRSGAPTWRRPTAATAVTSRSRRTRSSRPRAGAAPTPSRARRAATARRAAAAAGTVVPPSSGSGSTKYPSQYYAPGAGAAPSPAPSGNSGGGPPSGGGAPSGGGPPSTGGGGTGGTG